VQNTIPNARVWELLRFTEAHRRHTQDLARATASISTYFRILGVGHLEVKTHSPILGELLDPKGRHGQGSKHSCVFSSSKCKINDPPFDAERARVDLECGYAGQSTEKPGGRIDIAVRMARINDFN